MAPRRRRTKAEIERARKRAESSRRHHLKVNHNMTLEQYDSLLKWQNNVCDICQRATGANRKLSVDHDHAKARAMCIHPPEQSCEQCWRGLLCAPCNRMLGHLRDDPEALKRARRYVINPPAQVWRCIWRYLVAHS